VDGNAQLISAIVALWLALSGIVGAVIKYLLSEVKDLKEALEEINDSTAATNKTNAELASLFPGVLAERDALQRQLSSGHAKEDRS
jgi:hypothetical protein